MAAHSNPVPEPSSHQSGQLSEIRLDLADIPLEISVLFLVRQVISIEVWGPIWFDSHI